MLHFSITSSVHSRVSGFYGEGNLIYCAKLIVQHGLQIYVFLWNKSCVNGVFLSRHYQVCLDADWSK